MTAILAKTGDWLILALTPVERWQAARKLDNTFALQQWLYLAGIAVLLMLGGVYLFFAFKRHIKRVEQREDNFVEQAHRKGLSERERRILIYVAKLAGLKDYNAIFTMDKAYDLGAQELLRDTSSSGMDAEQIRLLAKELTSIREKLGFQKRTTVSVSVAASDSTKDSRPSSRSIPEGKILYITRRTSRDVDDLEAVVVRNSNNEFILRLPMRVSSPPNEQWQVRYFNGESVWEFDAPVISGAGDILVLAHSENIRFINRRRFKRVSVNKKAYIAEFPFQKKFFANSATGALLQPGEFKSKLTLPDFTPAILTELAGPGLRLESSLELTVGQRVAVVFELESQQNSETPDDKTSSEILARAIEGVGYVRHIKAVENGFSVAVELTGLSDSDVNELTRATNVAAVQADGRDEKKENESKALQSAAAALTL